MKNLIFLILLIPAFAFAGWSQPEWTDDCTVSVTKDAQGRMSVWTETCVGQDGKQTRKRVDTYTYYPSGEQEKINQKVLDSKDKTVSDKDINHFKDGKQPTIKINHVGAVEVIR